VSMLCCRSLAPTSPTDMPSKRLLSAVEDTDTYDREAKKRRTLPHRGKIKEVIEHFLDMLSPATSESLARFNEREINNNRDGVLPINIVRLEIKLEELLNVTNIESLDAELDEISSYLDDIQVEYDDYIVDAVAKGVTTVKRPLGEVVWGIREAKKQLPGMFL
jgi:hypothetical protein